MQQSDNNQQENKEKKRKRYQTETQEEALEKIEVKGYEKARLSFVFDKLCSYEAEPSSDEDSKEKLYQKRIEERARAKQMKIPKSNFKSKIMESQKKKKKYKEDDFEDNPEEKKEEKDDEPKKKKKNRKKFSKKALRKVIRTLCDEYAKDELNNMIWECDENLDGYVSEEEFINMYKKCISDEKEDQGKKMYYLVQFLMYDKDEKHEITIEDTLEILCARYPNNVDQAIDAIFDEEKKDEKTGKVKKVKKETIGYIEYCNRMHALAMQKRNEISNAKKIFCDKIKEEAIENVRKKRNYS